jgi:hypothetical protein
VRALLVATLACTGCDALLGISDFSPGTAADASVTVDVATVDVSTTCAGDPLVDGSLIRDECGIFASATATNGGSGARAAPLTKVSLAVLAAKVASKPFVFVCAETYLDTGVVQIDAPVEIIGTFTDCASGASSPGSTPTLPRRSQ